MKWMVGLVIDKVIKAVFNLIMEWWEAQQHKKRVQAKVKEIMREEKDPKKRAALIDSLLNN